MILLEVKIIIPEPIKSSLKIPPDEIDKRLKIELAIRLYEKGIASFGVARRIAELSKWEFIEILTRERIPIYYSEIDLQEDLEKLK